MFGMKKKNVVNATVYLKHVTSFDDGTRDGEFLITDEFLVQFLDDRRILIPISNVAEIHIMKQIL